MRPRSTQPPVSHDPRAAATFPRVRLHAESVQSNGAHIYACASAEADKLTFYAVDVKDGDLCDRPRGCKYPGVIVAPRSNATATALRRSNGVCQRIPRPRGN